MSTLNMNESKVLEIVRWLFDDNHLMDTSKLRPERNNFDTLEQVYESIVSNSNIYFKQFSSNNLKIIGDCDV